MKFITDSMLGKLARWLRILGFDAFFDPSLPLNHLIEMSKSSNVIFITRRKSLPDDVFLQNICYIPSERIEEQIRFVIKKFNLDTRMNLFTRCLECNTEVISIDKSLAKGKVPDKSFEGYENFYQCPKCKKIYWKGGHFLNTIKKLNNIIHN